MARYVDAIDLPVPLAEAFDYLEHSYFTDRACLEVQRRLGPMLDGDPHLGLEHRHEHWTRSLL